MKRITKLLLLAGIIAVFGLNKLSGQNLSLFVTPHPDDWQLFMNPNAYERIATSDQTVVFLHITSGDGGRGAGVNNYFLSREEGSLRAIRFLVNNLIQQPGLGTNMNSSTVTINGHNIQRYTYGNTVSYFLRLPDGNYDGSGYPITNNQSLQNLYNGTISTISAINGSTTYISISDLETTVRLLIESEAGTSGTIEFNAADTDLSINPADHSDHRYSSFLLQNVANQIGNVTINLYQEYVTNVLPENVFGANLLLNAATWGVTNSGLTDMRAYTTWDEVHNVWVARQYYRTVGVIDNEAPSVPTGLQAVSVSGNSVSLGWTASTDNGRVAGYNIYRNSQLYATSASNSFTDNDVESGQSYTYSVSAFDAAGNTSSLSSSISVTTLDNIPPSVPSGLTAEALSATSVRIAWNASTDNIQVAGYNVYRNGVLTSTSALDSYTDNAVVPGINNNYAVAAYDLAGNLSALSSSVNIITVDNLAPSVPASVSVSAVTTRSVNISWSASTDNVGVTGYNVYRNGTLVSTITDTNYSDNSLNPGTQYSFSISALDLAGNVSALSSALLVTTLVSTDTTAPSTPTNLVAISRTGSTITLGWNPSTDNSGVAGYNVFRDGVLRATVNVTTYSDINLISGLLYQFAVRAFDTAGNQSIPALLTVSTPDTISPSVPTGLQSLSITATSVNLGWNASTDNIGVSTYNVYRNGNLVGNTASTTYSNTGLTSGQSYNFAVRAMDASGNLSNLSTLISVNTPDTIIPSAPASISATASSTTTVNVSWAAATDNVGISSYNVYRNSNLVGNTTALSFTDNGLTSSTTYSYTVRAIDLAGNLGNPSASAVATTQSVPVNIALNRPTTVSSFEFGHDGSFAVDGIISTNNWWGSSPYPQWWSVDLQGVYELNRVVVVNYFDGARYYRYNIEVSLDGSTWTNLVNFTTNTTPATNAGNSFEVNNILARYIRVTMTYNSANVGVHIVEFEAYGVPANLQSDNQAPTVPSALGASVLSSSSVSLGWTASTDNIGVAGYNIFRNGTLLTTTAATTFVDNGLQPGTAYSYTVSAYDAAGNTSSLSNQVSVTTDVLPENIALNKTTSASGSEFGHESSLAVDGIVSQSNWWGNNPYPQWIMVDFGNTYDVNRVVVINYWDGARYYRYNIQASTDGVNWTTVVDFSSNTIPATSTGNSFILSNVTARYMRVNMTYNSANVGVHIVEFEAYGTIATQAQSFSLPNVLEDETNVSSELEDNTNPLQSASSSLLAFTESDLESDLTNNGTSETIGSGTSFVYFESVYPNPVRIGESLRLTFNVPQDENIVVEVYSSTGARLVIQQYSLFTGINEVTLSTNNLNSGIYLIVANISGQQEIRQIVIE